MTIFNVTDDASLAAALVSAVDGDIVNLAAGTYSSEYTINKDLTINGSKVGQVGSAAGRGLAESILSGGIKITAPGVTIDGVQVTGANDFTGALTSTTGLWITGTNATIQNTRFDGTAGVNGLTADTTATGMTITANAFTGYDTEIFALNGAAGAISSNVFSQAANEVGISTASTGLSIASNTFLNAGGAGSSVVASPPGSTDLSAQILANNTIPALSSAAGQTHSITVVVQNSGPFTVTGTVFDDSIKTSDDPNHAGALTLFGLGGNDELFGGAAADTLDGGTGNDILHGGGGSDTASYATASSAVTIDLGVLAAQNTVGAGSDTLDSIENVTGSNFADTLTGGASANTITGGQGLDTITGAAGNDVFVVNAGDVVSGETYNGGADTDTLTVTGTANFTGTSLLSIEALTFATAAASTATFTSSQIGGANLAAALSVTGDGQANSIVIHMNGTLLDLSGWALGSWTAATDTITVNGTTSADTITGSTGDDIIAGGQNNDLINGNAGNDTINYVIGDGSDTVDGGAGADDTLAVTGTGGNDTLAVVVVAGNIVSFAAGSVSNVEHFTLDLGAGTGDTLDYSGSNAVTVNLTTPAATGFDSIAGVENVTGGSGADSLTGDANANTLSGGSNNDTLTGRGGADTILGGSGDDNLIVAAGDAQTGETYDGGADNDTLTVTGTSNFTGASLFALENLTFSTAAISTVTVTSSQLGGSNLSSTLAVTGDGQANNIIANMNGSSIDLSGWTFATWTAGTDTITVNGTSAAETITGSGQNDAITGGTGLDTIVAGAGNDTLNVATGDVVSGETYNGGANTDTLRVSGTADFTGTSLLGLEALTFATSGASTVTLTSSQTGGANLSASLAVTGDGNANNVAINMNGVQLDVGNWTFGTWTAGTDTITIAGSSLGDTIIASSQNDVIDGGTGADNITAGAGDDTINYAIGAGSDTVDGGANTGVGDTLAATGTSANDTLAVVVTGGTISSLAGGTVTSIEHVTLNLGAGAGDTVDFTGSTAVTVDLSASSATGFDSFTGVENVTGGSGNDTLTGDGNANTLNGGSNDDTLAAGGGLDIVGGGTGNDILIVNAGDALSGESYDGGGDTDTLRVTGTATFSGASLLSIEALTFATATISTTTLTSSQIGGVNLAAALAVTGDGQTNSLVVNMNSSSLDLSAWTFGAWTAGTDTITINGSAAADAITGSTQNDIINAGTGVDSISAGTGDDTINYVVGDGADAIDGGANSDILAIGGTSGNDTMTVVLAGGVVITVAAGAVSNIEQVTLNLGGGTNDLLDYTTTSEVVTVNLTTPSATGFLSIAGVESVAGGSNNDALTGDTNANTLTGGGGDDTLTGAAGVDTVRGNAGNDIFVVGAGDAASGETYDGGADSDTLRVTGTANFTGAVLLSLENLTFVTSGASTVTLTSNQFGTGLLATNLAVTGDGQTNNIVVNASSNVDLLGLTFSSWTNGTDTITINGSANGESLIGSNLNDTISGNAGADVIQGGSGNDRLNGNAGRDVLTGNAGADLFVLDSTAQVDAAKHIIDTVSDYAAGDQIDLSALLGTAFGAGQGVNALVRVIASGSDANLQIDTDGTANGAKWQTIAHLDSIHAGDTVNVILSSGSPAGSNVTVSPSNLPVSSSMFSLGEFGAANFGGGWASQDQFPRVLGDVNGDGMDDIVGFGNAGASVALATGGAGNFATATAGIYEFGTASFGGGWASQNQFPRLLGDVNGDGMDDIVGFGNAGASVALATGGGNFATAIVGIYEFGAAGFGGGWATQDQFPRLLGDVNGDGMDDIIGFGYAGVSVALATGGGHFAAGSLKLAEFGAANFGGGWTTQDQFPRAVADVNGDGMADIIGFGNAGVSVALATGGGNFAPSVLKLAEFGAANFGGGWTQQNIFPRHVADVDGDGMADIVGFGYAGASVALATGGGSFEAAVLAVDEFGATNSAGGWTSQNQFPRELGDINGDGTADIVGFGLAGVTVSQLHGFLL